MATQFKSIFEVDFYDSEELSLLPCHSQIPIFGQSPEFTPSFACDSVFQESEAESKFIKLDLQKS